MMSEESTDGQTVERKLRDQIERMQRGLDAAGVGTYLYHIAEDRGEADAQMLALFGLPKDGILNLATALSTLIHPGDRQRYAEAVRRATDPNGSGVLREDIRVLQPDGAVRWIGVFGRTHFESEPRRAVRISGMAADVTSQKRVEDALRLREAQLNLITEMTPVMLTQCSRDMRYLYVNRAYAQMLRRAPEEIVGKRIVDVMGEEALATIQPYVNRVLNGEAVEYDDRVPFEGVGSRFLRAAYIPDTDEAGQVQGWIASIIDLTERVRTIEHLQQTEQKYRRMFMAMNEGVMQLDVLYDEAGHAVDFVFTDTNPAYERIIGATRAERVGRKASEFYNPIPFFDTFRKVAESGEPAFFEAYQSYIGKYVQISAFSTERKTLTVIFSDISARKQAEQILQTAYEVLDARVQERTNELATSNASRQLLIQQLVTAQEEERRRISRELHDQLGQLMTALDVGLKVLLAQGRGADFQERVEQLQKVTKHTSETIQSLAYELRPIALDDLGLAATLEFYLEEWSSRYRMEVHFESSGVSNLRLNPNVEITIYRIVQEAVTNILKHANASRVSVILDRTSERMMTIVEDNGQGFDVDAMLTNGEMRHPLGLVSMRERAEMLGGTLKIESSPGMGTTLFVRIPLNGTQAAE